MNLNIEPQMQSDIENKEIQVPRWWLRDFILMTVMLSNGKVATRASIVD